jgi:hypothetical protein
VESATLDDGIYELVQEPELGFSEDPANAVEILTEALNQSLEVSNIPDPNPTQEGKPRCITQYLIYYNFIFIYIYCILH